MDGASFHATLPREIRLFQESNIAMRRYFTAVAITRDGLSCHKVLKF